MSANQVVEKESLKKIDMSRAEKYGYDPLLTICKLALLQFYPIGTKLSFYKNNIYIQEPGWTQSASRTYYKDSKEDLEALLKPLVHCVNKYAVDNNNKYAKNILESSLLGLNNLQNTYRNNKPTVLMIQSYINLIDDSLHGKKKDYANLKTLYSDINSIKICYGLWSDLAIQVASDKLNLCITEFKKKLEDTQNLPNSQDIKEEEGEQVDTKSKEDVVETDVLNNSIHESINISHEFDRVKDEFIVFIDAKQKKYEEFLFA